MPASDTLATLTATAHTACLTTTSGAGYCWGADVGRDGEPARILNADGTPARVRLLAPQFVGTCAVTVDGEVRCDPQATGGWTDSAGAPIPAPPHCGSAACVLPLPVRGALGSQRVRAVTRGHDYVCALTEGGTPYCWGGNGMGQLGRGTWTPDASGGGGAVTREPGAIAGGVQFSQISSREWLTCGVALHNRGVYCWGYGQSGAVGDSALMHGCRGEPPYGNRTCSRALPTRVLPDSLDGRQPDPSDVQFSQVSSGGSMACAADVRGRAYCWGSNYRCGLGQCKRGDSHRAWQVQLPGRAVEVHAGYWFACARTLDARIFCWGTNNEGQLGSLATANAGPDGGPPDYAAAARAGEPDESYHDGCFQGGRCSPAAVEVGPGRRWHALAVGSDFACALGDDGRVHCWGSAGPALGTQPSIVTCENRSPHWKDTQCQPGPQPVSGLPRLAPPVRPGVAAAGGAGADSLGAGSTRIFASRRELRVVFPRDTAREWGWTELEDRNYSPWYAWTVSIDGMDGPRSLSVNIGRGYGQPFARRFGSLAELVSAAGASYCSPGMFQDCSRADISAAVQDQRVVITLRDSAIIARLVGLRPEWAQVWQSRPEVPTRFRQDSARIEYVDPQVPQPDSALRAEGAASRRRYEAEVNSIRRYISGPTHGRDGVWLAVGDSAALVVGETRCHFDVCSSYNPVESDSGWAVGDSSIISLRPVVAGRRRVWREGPSISVVARRIGRTTVRVRGLRGPGDTLPSREPVARSLEVQVRVTPPVARVEFTGREARGVVGQPVRLRVRVIDTRGRVIAGAPVSVLVEGGRYRRGMGASELEGFRFDAPGRHTFIATYGSHADTLVVDVAPAPATAPGAADHEAAVPAAPRTLSGRAGWPLPWAGVRVRTGEARWPANLPWSGWQEFVRARRQPVSAPAWPSTRPGGGAVRRFPDRW
ncbi:MAG TPA: hypothetical protein VF665_17575 [Longimicrobium sp.]|uniref:hypothetical protein n=1 Tax=Longimicrobium sp. TaxID=2029185 RepID=UPI002ED81F62